MLRLAKQKAKSTPHKPKDGSSQSRPYSFLDDPHAWRITASVAPVLLCSMSNTAQSVLRHFLVLHPSMRVLIFLGGLSLRYSFIPNASLRYMRLR